MIRQTAKLALLFFSAFIALGQRLSPNCSYVIDSKEWTLTGFCTVVTQYQMGWCKWRAKNPTGELISGNLTSTKKREYFWNCSVKLELPLPNGLYTCEVLFEEFEYNNDWRDAFSVRITDPGQPILKNCPEHVTEGENVTCECSPERDGEPRPVLTWPGHTDSSLLRLYEVRTNMTHTCEMSWGKKRTTALYTVTVSSNIVNHTNNNEVLIPIIGVAAVLITIVVTTCIIISTIRRKRAVSKNRALNFSPNDFEIIENSYYGGLQLGGEREVMTAGNDYVEVIEYARNERETIQPDLYLPVDTHEGRLIAQDELYAAVLKLKQ